MPVPSSAVHAGRGEYVVFFATGDVGDTPVSTGVTAGVPVPEVTGVADTIVGVTPDGGVVDGVIKVTEADEVILPSRSCADRSL